MKPDRTSEPAPTESVTVDAVAAVALKIGQEIWGEERFTELMTASDPPDAAVIDAALEEELSMHRVYGHRGLGGF